MAVKSKGDKIAVWDLTTKRLVTELPSSASTRILGLSPTGGLLAVRQLGGRTIEVWDARARTLNAALDHESDTRSLAFSPDGKLLATFDHNNDNGTISVVEWASNHTLTNFLVPPPRNTAAGVVVFSPKGDSLAIGEDFGTIRILNLRTGNMVTNQTPASQGITALAFSPSADLLAAAYCYSRETLCLWDARTGVLRGELTNDISLVKELAFTPDGRRLAAANGDRTIRIWDIADLTEVRRLRGHEGEGSALAFQSDRKTLVSGCKEATACFWDVTSASPPRAHVSFRISHGFEAMAG